MSRLDSALDQVGANPPSPVSSEDLEAIAARYVAASPHYSDSAELAAAVDDIPDLIAEVARLQEERARLLKASVTLTEGRLSFLDSSRPTDVHFRRENYAAFLSEVTE